MQGEPGPAGPAGATSIHSHIAWFTTTEHHYQINTPIPDECMGNQFWLRQGAHLLSCGERYMFAFGSTDVTARYMNADGTAAYSPVDVRSFPALLYCVY